MTKEMILNAMANSNKEYFGIRYDYNNYSVGDNCENSHQWYQDAFNLDNYDELTADEIEALYNADMGCYDAGELYGTCCIKITAESIDKAIERIAMYKHDNECELILIAGNYAEAGNDVDEIIIENAVVIAK